MYLLKDKAAVRRQDFDTIPHTEPRHHGVVVVALRQPDRQSILNRLAWFLDRFGNSDLRNRAFELRDRTYLVFPSLPEDPSQAEA